MKKITLFGMMWFLFNLSNLWASNVLKEMGLSRASRWEHTAPGFTSSISIFGGGPFNTGTFTIVNRKRGNDAVPETINTLAGTWEIIKQDRKYIMIASPQFSNGEEFKILPALKWELEVNSKTGEVVSIIERYGPRGRRMKPYERSSVIPFAFNLKFLEGRPFHAQQDGDVGSVELKFFRSELLRTPTMGSLRWQLHPQKDPPDRDEFGVVFAVKKDLVYLQGQSGINSLYRMQTELIHKKGKQRASSPQLTVALYPIIPLPIQRQAPFMPAPAIYDSQVFINHDLLLNTAWETTFQKKKWRVFIFPSGYGSLLQENQVIARGITVTHYGRFRLSLQRGGRLLMEPFINKNGNFYLQVLSDDSEKGPLPNGVTFKLTGRQQTDRPLVEGTCLPALKKIMAKKPL